MRVFIIPIIHLCHFHFVQKYNKGEDSMLQPFPYLMAFTFTMCDYLIILQAFRSLRSIHASDMTNKTEILRKDRRKGYILTRNCGSHEKQILTKIHKLEYFSSNMMISIHINRFIGSNISILLFLNFRDTEIFSMYGFDVELVVVIHR